MKTKILSPLRRDGYKAGMIMMLIALSTMLLTTACSSEDDLVNNTANTENTINKGYALPVTVNVTREGDAGTRATYNESTRTLAFSDGDQLFVEGLDAGGAGRFAGTLTWQSGGTFSGTIYTQEEWTGTADALFTAASASGIVKATLLPNGYESYNFLSIHNNGSDDLYDDVVAYNMLKAFVASETAKATGVEQLSFERATTYSSGFALAPANAILNFTISGLEAGAQDVTLSIDYGGLEYPVTGSVTPNASGVATFAIGVPDGANIKDMDTNLTVDTHNFTLPSSTTFDAGKIYNIARNASPLASVTTSDVGKVIGADGNIYANVEAAKAATTTACAIIAYVGSDTGESAPYNHGLAIAMKDANNGTETMWMYNDSEPYCSAVNPHQYTDIAAALAAKESGSSLSSGKNTGTYPAFQAALANSIETETGISAAAPATGTSGWFMPSIFQWNQIVNGLTGTTTPFTTSNISSLSYTAVNPKITAAGGVGLKAHNYWSSTEYGSDYAWKYNAIYGKAQATPDSKDTYVYVRAAFAF